MSEEEEVELLIGTYEDYVLGYQKLSASTSRPNKKRRSDDGHKSDKTNNSNNLISKQQTPIEQTFAVRAHTGSIRCLACTNDGSLVFSAGHDEMANLFSLSKRKLLHTFESAVNCATFVGNTHLICGCSDGIVYVYELKKKVMTPAKKLGGHKEAVVSLDAHPSGKVLLSVSKDFTMRTWNLIKGRSAYVTRHKLKEVQIVKWSKTGDEFAIASDKDIHLHKDGKLEFSIELNKRVNSIEFITDKVLIVASDSGFLDFIDIKKGISLMKFEAHETRIKSIQCFGHDDQVIRLATASSDGIIKTWTLSEPGAKEPKEDSKVDIGTRLTCMVAAVRKIA